MDEDFDPVCAIGTDIFKSLRRLHTCDITLWITDTDADVKRYPQKAVHWRRLGHATQPGMPSFPVDKVKDIWCSRMDSVYREDDPIISHRKSVVKLGVEQGVFVGEDAKEIWLGGDPGIHRSYHSDPELGLTSIAVNDRSWPWYGDLAHMYPMYERYH